MAVQWIAAPLAARASSNDGGKPVRRHTGTSQGAGMDGSGTRRLSEPNAAGAVLYLCSSCYAPTPKYTHKRTHARAHACTHAREAKARYTG